MGDTDAGQAEDLNGPKSGYNQNRRAISANVEVGANLGENALGRSLKTIVLVFCLLMCLLWQGIPGAFAQDYGFAPVSGQVTSPFGWRTDPITGGPRFHGGLDIAAPSGTPVYAPQAAYVAFSGYYGGYGNVVVLNHGNTLYTVYGHNSQLLVKAGDAVYRGQVISRVGSTGRSTGPHLHFEVHYNQQYLNPVTYLSYLQQSFPILAQAPQGHELAQSETAPVRVVKRPAQKSRHSGHGPMVQLVSGSNVEMIEF